MAITDRRGVSVSAVDTAIAGDPNPGLAIKAPCLVATTANITLSGLQTIDTVALAAGNRVLVWQQTDATTNGIYSASTGPWTRTIDADGNDNFASGMQAAVSGGATYARFVFQITSPDPITRGTSALNFALASVAPTRHINTTAPLAGGGDLTADRALSINANGITYSFLQQVAASSLVGNPTGALANGEGITLGATLAFSGAVLETAAMTGDISAVANSFATTLATVNTNVGAFGSATQVAEIAVNGKGLVTAASNVTVTPAVGSITGLGTGVATALGDAANAPGGFVTLPAVFQSGSLNPTGTTSTTAVAMGLGSTCTITPTTTRVRIHMHGTMSNSSASAGTVVQLQWGTGAAPSNGSGSVGTAVGSPSEGFDAGANAQFPWSLDAIVTGLTAGTPIWFDVSVKVGAGTGTLANVSCCAQSV
ncbi:MAG TPA: hypothetical protein VIO16_07875 [Dehalococcoidia bacterium]